MMRRLGRRTGSTAPFCELSLPDACPSVFRSLPLDPLWSSAAWFCCCWCAPTTVMRPLPAPGVTSLRCEDRLGCCSCSFSVCVAASLVTRDKPRLSACKEEPFASDRRRLRAASGVSSAKRTPLEVLVSRERLLVDSTLAVRAGSGTAGPAVVPGALAVEEGTTTAFPPAPASRRRCLSNKKRSDMLLAGWLLLKGFAASEAAGLACAMGGRKFTLAPSVSGHRRLLSVRHHT